jgi:hypothetical protein
LSRRLWKGSVHCLDQRSPSPWSYRICLSDDVYNSMEYTTNLAVLAEAPVFVVAVDGVVGFVIRVKSVANGVLKWARVNARDA